MNWLKKHWKLLTVFAVGIPVVYWLWQKYQTSSQGSSQAQNTTPTDSTQYATQFAVGGLGGSGSGGYSGAVDSSPVSSAPAPVSSTAPNTTAPAAPASTTPSGPPQPGEVLAPNGVWVEPGALAPLTPTTSAPPPAQTYGGGEGLVSTLFGARSATGFGGTPGRVGISDDLIPPVSNGEMPPAQPIETPGGSYGEHSVLSAITNRTPIIGAPIGTHR
jgi:hypothetical protein